MYEDYCEFCQILKRSKTNKIRKKDQIIYQDDIFFAFHDINKASALQHILVCTKQHIDTAIDIKQPQILIKMRQVGISILDKFSLQKNYVKDYRFGFHLKPFNSINHVHLHCFILPFKSFLSNRITYGYLLNTIEQVIQKIMIQNNVIKPRI